MSTSLRQSNFELYRIICMLLIVAYHMITHSGILTLDQFSGESSISLKTFIILFLGAWGKVGINCFLMITGYFMSTLKITLRKYIKLLCEVWFYNIVFFLFFSALGWQDFTLSSVARVLFPIWDFTTNFTSCYLAFFLTIPFWNILINNMTKRQHALLVGFMLVGYSAMGSIPGFHVSFSYVSWFGVIYLTSSYIRKYPNGRLFERKDLWAVVTVGLVLISCIGIVVGVRLLHRPYVFLVDTNKMLPVLIAISSFLWIKNINIRRNKFINNVAATTFGIFLIHDNSSAMRDWLWHDVVNVVSIYSLPTLMMLFMCLLIIMAIFVVCSLIDMCRINFIERPIFNMCNNAIQGLERKINSILCL